MSLLTAIRQARNFGLKSTDAMPLHIKRLKRTITQFCHPERFGKFYISSGKTKPSPKHANGQHAKFKDTFNYVRLCATLEATKAVNLGINQFHFYVNRPDSRWWLLMLDIDLHGDRDIGGDSDAHELALLIIDHEFGSEWGKVWTSVSRNGRGFYVYFIVPNPSLLVGTEEHMEIEDFTNCLKRYNILLKKTYNDRPHLFNGEKRTFRATVDAIKGSPYHVDWNRFLHSSKDGSHWAAIGDTSKAFPPIPKIDNRGTLATMPLTGIRSGPDAIDLMHGKDEIERFVAFCDDFKNKAFRSSFFFSKLGSVPISVSVEDEEEEEASETFATPDPPTADVLAKISRPPEAIRQPAVPISHSVEGERGEECIVGDDLERMNKCAADLVKRLGRPPSKPEILDHYHVLKLNTDSDHDGNRDRLAGTAADWWEINFDPCRLGGFSSTCHVALVEQHVTSTIREVIRKKNRSIYTDEQAAVVLYCVERSALTRNKRRDMQFTCGNASIATTFRKLKIQLCDRDMDEDKKVDIGRKKLAAIKQALVLAGLAEELEDGRWRAGKSKCYGLGRTHPGRQKYIDFKRRFIADTRKQKKGNAAAEAA